MRLSADEHALLALSCTEAGLTVSEALRRGARMAAGLGPTLDGDERAHALDLALQLRGIAANINQMARAMNGGRVPPNAELSQGFGSLVAVLDELQTAYRSLCGTSRRRITAPAEARP